VSVLAVTGTGTDVGKTIATAAIAALCPDVVTVMKPAQTGVTLRQAGDVDVVKHLVPHVETLELVRYPEPLAPATAARRSGIPTLGLGEVAEGIEEADADLVLIEGAGGLLVRFSDEPVLTFADLLAQLKIPTVLVVQAGLGTLNHTALTLEVMAMRGIECQGLIIGSWPLEFDLAMVENLHDLGELGTPIVGVLPAGVGKLVAGAFEQAARRSLSPVLGGEFDAAKFEERMKGLL